MAATVIIDAKQIVDRQTFHELFARAFGFPDFYGCNMDAWIDCMARLDEPFSTIQVSPGQLVTLKIEHADDLKERLPELYSMLLDLSAFVNWRRMESGHTPVLVVAAYG